MTLFYRFNAELHRSWKHLHDTKQTNKQANKQKALDSFFHFLSIPGLLMKMKTRQPSFFLIEMNKAIVNHSLTFRFQFFFNFQSFFPVA